MNLHAIVREAIGDRKGSSRQVGNLKDDRFTADTAEKTGTSERAIQRDASRGAQHMLWNEHGRFYATGGNVKVHRAWKVIRNPDTLEARRIEEIYGRPVVAAYVARDGYHLDQLAPVNMDFGKDEPD